MLSQNEGYEADLATYARIFDNHPDAALVLRILEVDGQPVDYIYLYANPQSCKILNAPLDSFVGKSHNEYFGMEDPHIGLYHRAVRDGVSGQRWLYNPEIRDFTDLSYCKVGEGLCLVTAHPIDRSMLDAQRTLAASMSAFDMIISVNLTRGVYHMINYDSFHNRTAPSSGDFDNLIEVGASTLPPQWRQPFYNTFSRQRQLEAFASGKQVISLDHQQYSDDGSIHWVRTQCILIGNTGSKDVVQVTTASLIDDLKLGEERLRKERQTVYDTLPGSIFRCTLEGDMPIISWNRGYKEIMGAAPDENTTLMSIVHPEDRLWVSTEIHKKAKTGDLVDLVYRIIDLNGQTRWLHCVGRPLHEATEKKEYFFLGFDISQEKLQAEALDQERRQYKALYDKSPCAIVEYTEEPDGSVHSTSCNPEARKLMGCDTPEGYENRRCKSSSWTILDASYTPQDAEDFRLHSNQLKEPGDIVRFESRRKNCHEGGSQYVYCTLELLELLPGGGRRIRDMFFDMEEQKRQEATQRKAEADLALKNETLRIALSNTRLSYLYYYPLENKIQLGDKAYDFLGVKDGYSGTLEETFASLIDPQSLQSMFDAYARASRGENNVEVDCRLSRGEIWCRSRLTIAQRDEQGRVTLVIAFVHDITDDHTRTAEIHETLEAIANSFTYIHRVHLPTQTVTAVRQTPRLDRLLGQKASIDYTINALVGEVVPAHLREDYLTFLDPDRIASVLRPDHVIEAQEFSLLVGETEHVWMRVNIILSSMADGKVESYLVALQDISAEKANEARAAEITKERNQMSDAISAMFFAAFAVDLEHDSYRTIKQATNCHQLLPQEGPYELLLNSHITFLSAQDGAELEKLFSLDNLRKTLSPEEPVITRELLVSAEEAALWLRVSMVLTRVYNKIPVQAALIMQDVTDQRELEQQKQDALRLAFQSAQQANEAKSSFLSRMSHDMRTPLNAIIGMTDIASADYSDAAQIQWCIERIDRSSQHLLSLINEVLDMSSIESGKIQLQQEEFNLSDLVEDLIAIIRPQAAERKQHLSVNLGVLRQESVIGDMHRLRQCCLNFLGNSLKYTPDGGKISMSLEEKPSPQPGTACYEFVFSDNGYGIRPDFLPHLFEPFAREEDSRISKIQGSGLGLAIADNIVRMMGGSIQVWSQPNQGSRFTVTIYLKTREGADTVSDSLAGRRILVIDRDLKRGQTLCHTLEEAGAETGWAPNIGDTRIDQDWDGVLFDPEGLGPAWLTATGELRERLGEHTPLILLWEGDWSQAEPEACRNGASILMSKPVFRSRLLQALEALLSGASPVEERLSPMELLNRLDYSNRRILVAEDNQINMEIVKKLLTATGARLECAKNGQEAVELVRSSPVGHFDLILMDVQMPVMNGYEATQAIRSLDRPDVKTLPIFAMTADAFAADVAMSKKSGMDEHIPKPLDLKLLHQLLEKWLG